MQYLIDTNILISANKITNPRDIHPSFWAKMEEILDRPDVISIDKVKDEIFYLEDELADWCKSNINKNFWRKSDNIMNEYAEILNWANSKGYNSRALAEFAEYKNADPFLVAYALNKKRSNNEDIVIVTLEVSRPESKKTIKIPDVCIPFNISYMNNNDFYRAIGINF